MGPQLSAAERDSLHRRETVSLALTKARAELAAAKNPAHRGMLEHAIAALQQQLKSG
jgi:hypothetical protein